MCIWMAKGKFREIIRGPDSSSFWVSRNLFHHIDRQARNGDTLLVKSREMTGRTQTLVWWFGGEGVKTTENKVKWGKFVRTGTIPGSP